MVRYSDLLGKRVEVEYRLGTLPLHAAGILTADSDEFIFVEQHFAQDGRTKTFQLKIPYHCIVRLTASNPEPLSCG